MLTTAKPNETTWSKHFGEQLDGYAFSEQGWVQSYGSSLREAADSIWRHQSSPADDARMDCLRAQSRTEKPMKGMLTGPVTILNWSFVRDDVPRSAASLPAGSRHSCRSLGPERARAYASFGVDEAALREWSPSRRSDWPGYA